ncbi:SPEF1-like_protein [Hexamita inflata]|uniref:SPEF1-like protein n=1 Tax=Hexamita inflata TaxID=28002 RepID=A0AA86NS05_9EUKA|nr:SPEF1-like protein [Hexamita inflata]CAI9944918.1 SPEF1-like protein [Hexamita inflata]
MPLQPLQPDQKQQIYNWLLKLDLPKPTSFIHRDFSDACLLAKLIKLYLPNLVEVHNYVAAVGVPKKLENWALMQHKVLKKLDIKLSTQEQTDLASAKPGTIESLLFQLKARFDDLSQKEEHIVQQQSVFEEEPVEVPKKPMREIRGKERQIEIVKECVECQLKNEKIDEQAQEIKLLEEKIEKLQQLVRLKDGKNKALQQQSEQYLNKLRQLGAE